MSVHEKIKRRECACLQPAGNPLQKDQWATSLEEGCSHAVQWATQSVAQEGVFSVQCATQSVAQEGVFVVQRASQSVAQEGVFAVQRAGFICGCKAVQCKRCRKCGGRASQGIARLGEPGRGQGEASEASVCI